MLNKNSIQLAFYHVKSLVEIMEFDLAEIYCDQYIEYAKMNFGHKNFMTNNLSFELAKILYEKGLFKKSNEIVEKVLKNLIKYSNDEFNPLFDKTENLFLHTLIKLKLFEEANDYIFNINNEVMVEYFDSDSIEEFFNQDFSIDEKESEYLKITAISEKDSFKKFEIFQQLYFAWLHSDGQNDLITLKYKKNYAMALMKMYKDDFSLPKQLLSEVIITYNDNNYLINNDILATKYLYAKILFLESNYEESLQIFNELYYYNKKMKIENSIESIRDLTFLIKIHTKMKKFNLVKKYVYELTAIVESIKTSNPMTWCYCMLFVSKTLFFEGNLEKSKEILLEVYEIYGNIYGKYGNKQLKVLMDLFSVLINLKEYNFLICNFENFNKFHNDKYVLSYNNKIRIKKKLLTLYFYKNKKNEVSKILKEFTELIAEIEESNDIDIEKITFDLNYSYNF